MKKNENNLKQICLIIIYLFFSWQSFSQDTCSNSNADYDPDIVGLILVEEMPKFNGDNSLKSFNKYIHERLTYPDSCSSENINSKMFVSFIVDTTGSVADIQFVKSICPEMDKIIYQILTDSPKWEPGSNRNKKVAVKFSIPITIDFR